MLKKREKDYDLCNWIAYNIHICQSYIHETGQISALALCIDLIWFKLLDVQNAFIKIPSNQHKPVQLNLFSCGTSIIQLVEMYKIETNWIYLF